MSAARQCFAVISSIFTQNKEAGGGGGLGPYPTCRSATGKCIFKSMRQDLFGFTRKLISDVPLQGQFVME